MATKKQNILYYGWLSHKNLGDEALFASSKQVFEHLNLIPFLPLVNRLSKFQLEWMIRISRSKACLVGGGTLIYTPQIKFYEHIQNRVPLFFFGAGVEDLQHKGGKPVSQELASQWNKLLAQSALVSVRGPYSKRLLEENGFSNALIVGDPALSLADDQISAKKSRHIAINFGDTKGNLWGGDDQHVYDFCLELAHHLLSRGFHVSLFSVYSKDTAFLTKLYKDLKGNVTLHAYHQFSNEVMDYLRDVDLLIGQKLHAVILAHCAFTPAIMLEYRAKCQDYMASMGLELLNFRCDHLSLSEIYPLIENLLINSAQHQNYLYEKVLEYKNIQREVVVNLMDSL